MFSKNSHPLGLSLHVFFTTGPLSCISGQIYRCVKFSLVQQCQGNEHCNYTVIQGDRMID